MLRRLDDDTLAQDEKEYLLNLAGNYNDLKTMFGVVNATILPAGMN
jgi:hypothetical protein